LLLRIRHGGVATVVVFAHVAVASAGVPSPPPPVCVDAALRSFPITPVSIPITPVPSPPSSIMRVDAALLTPPPSASLLAPLSTPLPTSSWRAPVAKGLLRAR
jgi:hypothetical protein